MHDLLVTPRNINPKRRTQRAEIGRLSLQSGNYSIDAAGVLRLGRIAQENGSRPH